jgi:hypothetical protein
MAGYGGLANAMTLEEELYEVDKLRAGFDTPFEEVEKRCAALLERYKSPEEHAKIYFQLAQVEGQSGLQHPKRLINYIEKALALPLEPAKRVRLYIYWGDVLQVAHRGVRGAELAAARREAVMPYLHGLKELVQYDLPEAKPELPGIMVRNYDGPQDTQEYQELLEAQRRQVEARDKAVFQRRMIDHRGVLTSQIASMYSRLPFATDELQSLAEEVLQDPSEVDRLMTKVRARVRKRVEAVGGAVLRELPGELDTVLATSSGEGDLGGPAKGAVPAAAESDQAPPARLHTLSPVATRPEDDRGLPHAAIAVGVLAVIVIAGTVVWRFAARKRRG